MIKQYNVTVNGTTYEVTVESAAGGRMASAPVSRAAAAPVARAAAPAPVATARGRQPMMKAKQVIRMGRRRILAASSVAVSRSVPCLSSSTANSTMRMAFLAASAISTMRPISE